MEGNKKLLTITIPCYNSQDYIEHCVESLLPGGEKVEILIVDDGSSDQTAEIADRIEEQHPGIVRAIHKENGGHGDAVMTGLREASGLFFKVVDSDDCVEEEAYRTILRFLQAVVEKKKELDLLISNFVYDKQGEEEHRKKVMRYPNLPKKRFFTWEEAGRFQPGHYLLMHSVIYRTALLREVGLELPKHTFYVDNIYVYVPLPAVKTMYYLPVKFYRYYTGRDDQSVNQQVMTRRVMQQYRVNELMFQAYDLERLDNRWLKSYLYAYLQIMCTITTSYLALNRDRDKWAARKTLWKDMKGWNLKMYRHLRWSPQGILTNLPGKLGQYVMIGGYKLFQKLFGFN